MSERSFRFKPIETRYNGYRFRSRLEARWAVFFDELGIEYQYEPEGYALDGIAYLPDFWLPEQKCFFEVKGEVPTEDEIEKAKRLALYMQKLVYIASGSISLPPNDICNKIITIVPPSLMKQQKLFDSLGEEIESRYKQPEVIPEVLLLLQQLSDIGMQAEIVSEELTLSQNLFYWDGLDISFKEFIGLIPLQASALEKMAPMLEKHWNDLYQALETDLGWENYFQRTRVLRSDETEWLECSHCDKVALLASNDWPHLDCPKGKGKWNRETSRLIAAYTAAREARF